MTLVPRRRLGPATRVAFLLAATLGAWACGKKGPPLAPTVRVPAAVSDVVVQRMGSMVYVDCALPTQNADGSQPVDLARVEVYAITTEPLATLPPDLDDLIDVATLVGVVEVGPPRDPAEPQLVGPPSPFPTEPRPGDRATVIERLTPDLFVPVDPQPSSRRRRERTDEEEVPGPIVPHLSMGLDPPLRRTYIVVGLSNRGRYGSASARTNVPLRGAPSPPAAPSIVYTETAATVESPVPPNARRRVQEPAQAPVLAGRPIIDWPGGWTYEVYEVGTTGPSRMPRPLHTAPLEVPRYSDPRVTFGIERCYLVRSVYAFRGMTVKSEPSPRACVTFRDTFPPAPPTGLAAVASEGGINLIWTAGTEADLAGYLVLRARAAGETLQPLTAAPIAGTSYRDTTVEPGRQYVYAVQAVDRAQPPNASKPSEPIPVTAR